MVIEEFLLKKAADIAIQKVANALRTADVKVTSTDKDMEQAVHAHLREVKNWCSEITFSDLRKAKTTVDTYLPLDVYLTPRRLRLTEEPEPELVPLQSLFDDPELNHLIVLGQPGAGKTTSMQYLCHRVLFDDTFCSERLSVPIMLRLRELNSRHARPSQQEIGSASLTARLFDLLGLSISFPPELICEEAADRRKALRDRALSNALDSLGCLIVLDGFDEIAHKASREAFLEELRRLVLSLDRAVIVLTSRTGDLNVSINRMALYEISPLSGLQVERFAERWLGHEDGAQLVSQFRASPFSDAAVRPLTLAYLCAVYERIGRIPDKPKTVYDRVVRLLIHEWDEQRSVSRASTYAGFDVDRKLDFLSHMAFVLTTSSRKSVFGRADLVRAYTRIYSNFGLPSAEAERVALELESHTGLLLQSGVETFEFSHKSLQEYLTAWHIVRLPKIPDELRIVAMLPNELAIATSISSSSSQYFAVLVHERLAKLAAVVKQQRRGASHRRLIPDNFHAFIRPFIARLLVEKPVFDRAPIVGAALLSLYSFYLESSIRQSVQIELFLDDRLGEDFEQLALLIRDRVDLSELLESYVVTDRQEGIGGVQVMRLVRENVARGPGIKRANSRAPWLAMLANELWVRESLLSTKRTVA